jgi:hypothetical protein
MLILYSKDHLIKVSIIVKKYNKFKMFYKENKLMKTKIIRMKTANKILVKNVQVLKSILLNKLYKIFKRTKKIEI